MPLFLILFQKNKKKNNSIIAFYFFYSILSDLFLHTLSLKYLNSEFYSYRIFTVIEFLSFSVILNQIITNNRLKKLILYSGVIFFVSLLFDLITNPIENFDSLPTGVESILILLYCILVLYEQITMGKPLFSFPVLFSISLILFFSGTFFLFILSQNNFENEEFSVLYDYIVAISKILMTLLISLGLIANRKVDSKHQRTLQNV